MSELKKCPNCGTETNSDDDFCPDCGYLFIDGVTCANHADRLALGVCVICAEAYCDDCLSNEDGIYLCSEHKDMELIEGFAKVKGGTDALEIEYFKNALKQEGLHPFIFKRKASPLHMGYENHSLFRASGEKPGHSVNEYKLMTPFAETLRAISIIAALDDD